MLVALAALAAACTAFDERETNVPIDAGGDAAPPPDEEDLAPDEHGTDPADASVVDAEPVPDGGRIVFVSSQGIHGAFERTETGGGDGFCTRLANAAGLPGAYTAFARRDGGFGADLGDAGAFYGLDGLLRFEAPPGAETPALAPVNVNERMQRIEGSRVWTGAGNRTNERCRGWTDRTTSLGNVGNPQDPGRWLNDARTSRCDRVRRLYCFQL
jgi:hypothetical protein